MSIPIASIYPVRGIGITLRRSIKYRQIAASIKEIGIIEHPVVARDKSEVDRYILLDGHIRIEVLKDLGQTEVTCLVSMDDESYTYNKRINRLAVVQEHLMIMQAVQRGVPQERIASALNINLNTVFKKTKLLDGICLEVVDLLHDKPAATNAFSALRKMTPVRQIESAQLMVAMNRYSVAYAQSLLAATPPEQLISPKKSKLPTGLTPEQLDLMQRESMNLDRQFRVAERTYGEDHLDLVIVRAYVSKLISNARVKKFLRQNYGDILSELDRLTDASNEKRVSSR